MINEEYLLSRTYGCLHRLSADRFSTTVVVVVPIPFETMLTPPPEMVQSHRMFEDIPWPTAATSTASTEPSHGPILKVRVPFDAA